MSITDELREYAQSWRETPNLMDELDAGDIDGLLGDIEHIADRIDADSEDNERFRREAEPFCDRLREASAERADVTLFGVDYTALPLDADGEVIHIGDMMERGKARGRVIALMLSNYPKKWGGKLHWGIQLEGEQAPTALDNLFHHYHAPTVEDVLREFAEKVIDSQIPSVHPTYEEAIAEFAARLRLAKEDE